jgi:deoxyribodipyrimidine photo-lyase
MVQTTETIRHTGSFIMVNIHWFRNDLRLHDNPALCHTVHLSSVNDKDGVLPIFIFDNTRVFGSCVQSRLNSSLKCGPRRAQFLLEAVADLRHNLERCGSGLIISVGKTEQIIGEIALQTSGVVNIVCQEEICSEELSINEAVQIALNAQGNEFNLRSISGSTLYDPSTLPFDGGVDGIPDTFSPFRKEVEKWCKIGVPLDAPAHDRLKLPHNICSILEGSGTSLDYMPTLEDLGYNSEDIESISTIDSRSAMPKGSKGGETFALSRVQEYLWELDLIQTYFCSRNGMIGASYSTKLAPWLACGCVSPRYIAKECARYEELRVKNKSTYW